MTIKLLLLKSGEDIIADVKDLSVEERTVGYLLNTPYIVKINRGDISLETQNSQANKVSLTFYPYIPLTDQKEIPIPSDWVITIVEPVGQLKKMYEERINKDGKTNENSGTDEQSDSDQSD